MAANDLIKEEQLDQVVSDAETALDNRVSFVEAQARTPVERRQARDNTLSMPDAVLNIAALKLAEIDQYLHVLEAGSWFKWEPASTDTADDILVVVKTGHVGAGRWHRSYKGLPDFRWWEADATGVTNVTAKIQAFWNACANLKSGLTAAMPDGIYNCGTDTLVVPDGLNISHDKDTVYLRTGVASGYLIEVGSNCTWKGGILRRPATVVDAIINDDSSIRAFEEVNAKICDVRVEGAFYLGPQLARCTSSKIIGGSSKGMVSRGVYIYLANTDCHIENFTANCYRLGTTTRLTSYGGQIFSASDGVNDGCSITKSRAFGATGQGFSAGDLTKNCSIEGNAITDIGAYGIYVTEANGNRASDVTVRGNDVSNCDIYGFYALGCDDCLFEDNTSDGAVSAVRSLNNNNLRVRDIQASGFSGVSVDVQNSPETKLENYCWDGAPNIGVFVNIGSPEFYLGRGCVKNGLNTDVYFISPRWKVIGLDAQGGAGYGIVAQAGADNGLYDQCTFVQTAAFYVNDGAAGTLVGTNHTRTAT